MIRPSFAEPLSTRPNVRRRINNEEGPAAKGIGPHRDCVAPELLPPMSHFQVMASGVSGIVVINDRGSVFGDGQSFPQRNLLSKLLLSTFSGVIANQPVVWVCEDDRAFGQKIDRSRKPFFSPFVSLTWGYLSAIDTFPEEVRV